MTENYNLKTVHRLFSQGRYHDAHAILKHLTNTFPEFELYKNKLKECQSLIQINKSNSATSISHKLDHIEQLLLSAETALLAGDHSNAIELAHQIIRQKPDERRAYQIGEQAAIELKQFPEANEFFLRQPAIKNPPLPRKRGKNPVLPKGFTLPEIVGPGNDYRHILEAASIFANTQPNYTEKVTIVITTYNRSSILANTLAAITHQTYPKSLMQIIVVDDGSADDIFSVLRRYEQRLDLSYARQPDIGFRAAAARNLGIRLAQCETIIFFDADILPCPKDVENYMHVMHVSSDAVLIGHRRYVDVSNIDDLRILKDIDVALSLPDINTSNDVANEKSQSGHSIDWRLPIYEKTNFLLDDLWPFTKFASGNIAVSRKLIEQAGYFDEEFNHWGCEDVELGYRLYQQGAYFIPMIDVMSLHQEPIQDNSGSSGAPKSQESFRAKGHRITRKILAQKCPAPTVRSYREASDFEIPKVSIYIPAFNAEKYIKDAIDSCLNQNFSDLEVCVCNDGSTDGTLRILESHFSDNPRVHWITQANGGIGSATNSAIRMCRGMYIGQLDADDLLKPDAVQTCVSFLDNNDIDGVYTDYELIDIDGNYVRDGWCGGEFDRSWMATGMIATAFRMFKRRAWARTIGSNEKIANAVDFDLWLKLNEVGRIAHIHKILYRYRWHGLNTSVKNRKQQENNHLRVVGDSFNRTGLSDFWIIESTENKLNPRDFRVKRRFTQTETQPEDIIFLIPTCEKYKTKANSQRETWIKHLNHHRFRYFFVQGNPSLKHVIVEDDTIFTPCNDHYETLLLKLSLAYKFLIQQFDFNYIFKIDDDCFLNIDNVIKNLIPQLGHHQYYGGAVHRKGIAMNNKWHYGKCHSPIFEIPYDYDIAPIDFAKGGYGYLLRRDAASTIASCSYIFYEELSQGVYSYEDVRIAITLKELGISVKELEGYLISKSGDTDNFTVAHDLSKPEQFLEIHRRTIIQEFSG